MFCATMATRMTTIKTTTTTMVTKMAMSMVVTTTMIRKIVMWIMLPMIRLTMMTKWGARRGVGAVVGGERRDGECLKVFGKRGVLEITYFFMY